MCGIVGYVGEQQSAPILVSGLKKLEYRGYDSAGLAVVNGGKLSVVRASGKLKNLEARVGSRAAPGHARHRPHPLGDPRPADRRERPPAHATTGVAVVHNGIIENHLELKDELTRAGARLRLRDRHRGLRAPHRRRAEAGQGAARGGAGRGGAGAAAPTRWRWSAADDPDRMVATKDSSPMVVGLAEGQNFVATDVPALLEHTRDMVFLEEGDLAVLSRTRVDLFDRAGKPVHRPTRRIDWTPMMAEKGGHKHFMHKEICEQPRALADTLRGRVLLSEGDVFFEGWSARAPRRCSGCRGSPSSPAAPRWHAGLAGRAMIESLARIPVEVELASRVPLPRSARGTRPAGHRHQPVRRDRWTRSRAARGARPAARAP